MSLKGSDTLKDTETTIRLRDPISGGVMELRLELDTEREVVLDAKYRLTDMQEEASAIKLITKTIRQKGFLFCLALTDDDVIDYSECSSLNERQIPNMSLLALKLALSEFIMRKYAIEIGIVKSREEFLEEFLAGHPMYEMFKDIEFS